LGNVIVEALACGLLVASTDCHHGPAKILAGGHSGRLKPVGDPDALDRAIPEGLLDRCEFVFEVPYFAC
jgi:glycosyltransferase involved in cell wall biosynthesis